MISKNKTLFTILFTVFIDLLGFTIIIPLLVQIIQGDQSILGNAVSIEYKSIILGWLTASYAIGTFFAAPILGDLSDKYGRKPLLFISLLGTTIARILFVIGIITGNILLLFISRILDGLTGGNISIAQAALTDITDIKDRAKTFALFGMTFGLGFILGPAIGAIFSGITIHHTIPSVATPMIFATILSILALIANQLLFPETLKHKDKLKKVNVNKAFKNIVSAFKTKGISQLLTGIFLFNLGFNAFTTFAGNFWKIQFNFSDKDIALRFSLIGIVLFITQGIARKFFENFDSLKALKYFTLPLAIIILAQAYPIIFSSLSTNIWITWILCVITPAIAALITPNLSAVISKSVSQNKQGEILGLTTSVTSLAQAIPPIIAGYGTSLNIAAPFFMAFVFIASSAIVFNLIKTNTVKQYE